MVTKRFLAFAILFIVLAGIFVPHIVSAADGSACSPSVWDALNPATSIKCALEGLVRTLGYFMMAISGLILTLVGTLLDKVVDETVINMAQNISGPMELAIVLMRLGRHFEMWPIYVLYSFCFMQLLEPCF